MWVISDEDKYIASTWGTVVRLQKGVAKEVGHDVGLLCLQEGCSEVKGEQAPVQETPVEIQTELETLDAVIEATSPLTDLDGMTKVELEEYGRTIGIELDRRKKKSDLIAEIETAQS